MTPSVFEWRKSPSQIAVHLVTPGWVPQKPKEKAVEPVLFSLDELREYRAQSHTLTQCAARFGKSINTIRRLLQEQTSQRTKTVIVTADEIRQLRGEGHSWRELAKRFSCASSTLRARLGERSSSEVLAKVKARYAKAARKQGKGRQIYMTDSQFAAFKAMGGGDWLRSLLTKA